MEFSLLQWVLITIIFTWSGFVRSGFGFGGALFTLPFLLLVHDDPLFFLPIIGLHLLFFAPLTIFQNSKQSVNGTFGASDIKINWEFLRFAFLVMIVPKIVGVIGLISLPQQLVNTIIFILIGVYSVTYIIKKPFKSNSNFTDFILLALGGYVSGNSLIGGPMIVAVAMKRIPPPEFRQTLFVLWIFLVMIKMIAFWVANVPIYYLVALYLLPFAWLGNNIGNKLHQRILTKDTSKIQQLIGILLLFSSILGLLNALH